MVCDAWFANVTGYEAAFLRAYAAALSLEISQLFVRNVSCGSVVVSLGVLDPSNSLSTTTLDTDAATLDLVASDPDLFTGVTATISAAVQSSVFLTLSPTPAPTNAPTTAAEAAGSGSSAISGISAGGAIALIIILVVVGVIVLAGVGYFCYTRNSQNNKIPASSRFDADAPTVTAQVVPEDEPQPPQSFQDAQYQTHHGHQAVRITPEPAPGSTTIET